MRFKCCAKNSRKDQAIMDTHEFLKALADANRLRIICILRSGSKCVCEIFTAMGISQKLASHHLLQLSRIGILDRKREGNFIHYALNEKKLAGYKKMFNQVIG